MTIIKKGLLPAACIIALLTLNSCDSGSEAEKKEEMPDTLTVVSDTSRNNIESDVSYTLPSTLQIASIFKKSGLSYYSGLTNKTENLNTYKASSPFVKALNLGVYSADLSYCMLNKQNEECKNYFKVCKELSSELGLAKAFESVAKRMEKNMNDQDSLALILVAIQMETDNILASSDEEYKSVISFTGAWIESMHLGMRVHAKEGHVNMTAKLVEQMGIAENIIKALKAHSARDKEIDGLVKQMSSLNDIYNNFKSVKEIKATDPDVIDPAKLEIGVQELLGFSSRLEEIRAQIIKG